jgi:ABC-type sugar transport system ATPase subunit
LNVHPLDTYLGLVIGYTSFAIPFGDHGARHHWGGRVHEYVEQPALPADPDLVEQQADVASRAAAEFQRNVQDRHVVVDVGEEMITARLPRQQRFERDEKVVFAVDPASLHVFDPESGAAIR